MSQKEQINHTVKRLLYAVAIKVGSEPTYTNVFKQFSKVEGFLKPNGDPNVIYDTHINKWMNSGNNPSGDRETICLNCINILLFDTKDNFVKSFEEPWDGICLDEAIKLKVEEAIQKKDCFNFKNVLIAPDYSLDPSHLMAQIKNPRTKETLKPHFLYHSPRSSQIWEDIKESDNYMLYRYCKEGLRELLKSDEWLHRQPNLNLVFNLGAGSASKDKLILSSLNKCANRKTFVWVDASLHMLRRTIKDVNCSSYGNVNCLALAADFELPEKLMKILNDSFPKVVNFDKNNDKNKAFFIMGFTLSNLDEESFFSTYKHICSEGDLFIFPMEFIPEDGTDTGMCRITFENKLRNSYDFDDGNLLADAWLSLLEPGYKLETHIPAEIQKENFNHTDRSISITFSCLIKEPTFGSVNKIISAKSTRHYKADYINYLQSLGFNLLDETVPREGVTTLLVGYKTTKLT